MTGPEVTVIVPVLNERDHIESLVAALLAQTRPLEEVVFADGGSTDGTRELLAEIAAGDQRIRWVEGPGGIAENRNAAIDAARGSIITCTDAGCLPDPEWLARVTEPLRSGEAEWVSGVAVPMTSSGRVAVSGLAFVAVPEEVETPYHLPPGASQAFLKEAWARVSGFPERMLAAEDTVFGQRMLWAGYRPLLRADAVVRWSSPTDPFGMLSKAFRWGRADGRAATVDQAYTRLLIAYWSATVAAIVAVVFGLWPVAAAIVFVSLIAVAYRVRRRLSYLDRWWRRLLFPGAYAAKVLAQTLGWGFGVASRLTVRKVYALVTQSVRRTSVRVRRLIRPLVPDRLVRWLRRGVSVSMKSASIDVVAASRADAKRWLLATPPTYRVRVRKEPAAAAPGLVVRTVSSVLLGPELSGLLDAPFADPQIEVSVVGEAEPPPVRRRSVVEPVVAPVAVAVRTTITDFPATDDPAVALDMARQAGLRMALTPLPVTGPPPGRRDPIVDPGSVVILAAVPMHDVGGGSRGAQLAQEFLRRGFHVVYAYMFDAAESVDLGVRFVHPNLETVPAGGSDQLFERVLDGVFARLRTTHRLAVVEIPHPSYLGALKVLREHGYVVGYDLIDDWSDPVLGMWGFNPDAERAVVVISDILMASAASLTERLASMARREVTLVPNAVNTRLFAPGPRSIPDDFPAGDGPVFEYHGSLYGDWFDWEGLAAVAAAFADARIVVIGDPPRHRPSLPDNVHFLGLKPQHQLAAYLALSDLGLLPFVVSDTTHAVSPLKVYEWLAMGVPVAAPPLRTLSDLPGVYTGVDLVDAVSAATTGAPPDAAWARAEHGWEKRVAKILDISGIPEADANTPVVVTMRANPVYSKTERRLF